MLLKAALALLACHGSSGFYLPGIAPIDRLEGEKIDIQVSSLTSSAGLPFEQYTVPFCAPEKVDSEAENLGEVLRGERIQNSPYNLTMGQELSCKILCKRKYDSKQVEQFTDLIHDDYVLNW
jgi:transmembrane 9 superfamily protein 2/4